MPSLAALPAAVSGLLGNTTFWLLAAAAWLAYELYRRTFIESYADDAKTIAYVPFWHWPDPFRMTKNILNEYEYLQKYGQVVRFVNAFHPDQRMIIISNPEVMREIYLGKDWQKFDRAHHTLEFAQLFAGGLILIENGQRWKEARDLFGKSFTNVKVRLYAPILKEIQATFMEKLAEESDNGRKEFNIQPMMTKFTFSVILRLVFGANLPVFEKEGEKYLHAWDELISLSGILAFLQRGLGDWALALAPDVKRRVLAGADVLHQIVFENIRRRERGEKPKDWSIFDEAYDNGIPQWMCDNNYAELLKQLMTMLFGGHDTTAAMLGFWAGELVQHPEWQDRVRAEVLAEFGTDDDLSLEKLETLQTLNATMKEVLRLYPAAPHGGQRTAFEDFDFRWKDPKTGQEKMIHFYKGDLILPSCFITNRHPENWPEHGDEFDPARWLKDPSGGSTHLFSYVPFGNGARKCLGERLAHNEGRLVMAGILRKYKIEPAKGWKLDIDQRAMLIPNGVQVKLVPL